MFMSCAWNCFLPLQLCYFIRLKRKRSLLLIKLSLNTPVTSDSPDLQYMNYFPSLWIQQPIQKL